MGLKIIMGNNLNIIGDYCNIDALIFKWGQTYECRNTKAER